MSIDRQLPNESFNVRIRCGEHCWLHSEIEEAGKQLAAFGGLLIALAWDDATEFDDSKEAVIVDPSY